LPITASFSFYTGKAARSCKRAGGKSEKSTPVDRKRRKPTGYLAIDTTRNRFHHLKHLRRILVIRGGAIGDFILTIPALKLLRDAFPGSHLEILGYKHIVALAQMSGYADATRSIEYGPLSSFFICEGELAPDLVNYFGGFQQVISYLFDPEQIFSNNLKRAGVRNLMTGSPKITGERHAARQLARPLESLGLYLDDPAAVISPNESRKVVRSVIAIHPGSGSEGKNWPLERFIEVAAALFRSSKDTRLLVIEGEADEGRATQLARALPGERVSRVTNLPLPDLAGVLQNCGFFIGHDSGISHLAAAVGTPSLLLFGPTDPLIWAPANRNVKVLRAPQEILNRLSVEMVLAALHDL
jgi:ADP-heptose:LPS heptosyltransferase